MFLDWWSKLCEYLEQTLARTYKHIKALSPVHELNPRPSCCEMTALTKEFVIFSLSIYQFILILLINLYLLINSPERPHIWQTSSTISPRLVTSAPQMQTFWPSWVLPAPPIKNLERRFTCLVQKSAENLHVLTCAASACTASHW